MIFPEGLMVKAKDITKHSSHYNVKIDGTNQKVHTGAAFFALYSQILRSNYFSKKIKNTKKFQRKYFIKDLKNINEKETVIVPINISYSKITKGKNYLYRMIKSLFSHMPDSFKEELEIETNLILHSKMTIQILKSISIKDILNDSLEKELNQEKIGKTFKVLFDRKEGDYFIGRTEFDSPDVDNEVLVKTEGNFVRIGDFANIKITEATEYDLYGE
ncbi:MAG: TRAM domain-containing protein, partial [Campylobacteraceae bacterium]|nr:TRAM domain-containing protein [Campylobacteraceae bacterium]